MEKKQFDFLNFFYGIGAAIILFAAMFKFVGWEYANELFIVGVVVEAIVFLISGFDWRSTKKEFDWSKVFPQLNNDAGELQMINPSFAELTQQQQIEKIIKTILTINNSVDELNNATLKLTKTVNNMEANYDTITKSTIAYQKEIDVLKNKIAAANANLKALENLNINKF